MKKILFSAFLLTFLLSQIFVAYGEAELIGASYDDKLRPAVMTNLEGDGSNLSTNQGNSRVYENINKDVIYSSDYLENVSNIGEKFILMLNDSYNKKYISKEEYDKLQSMVNDFADIFNYSNNYLYEKGEIDEFNWNHSKKVLGGIEYKYFKDGQRIYLCYGIRHIKAAMDFVTYGLLDLDDRLLNLNDLATKSDGIIMAVKLSGGEKKALEGTYKSAYAGVPEYAEKYVAYAVNKGLIESAPEGTVWDDSDFNFDEMTSLYARVLGNKVSSEGKEGYYTKENTPSLLPYMDYRLGAYLDIGAGAVKLESGEAVRNSDLISMANKILYRKFRDQGIRVIDNLVNEGIVSKDVKNHIDEQTYYGQRGLYGTEVVNSNVNDLTKLLYLYDKHYSNVDGHYKSQPSIYDKGIVGKVNASVNMYTVYNSKDELYSIAVQMLNDYGLPKMDAENFMKKVLSRKGNDTNTKTTRYTGKDFIISGYYVDYNNVVRIDFGEK